MLSQLEQYLTFENIYLWTNFGLIPFWLMLIFIPNATITRFFINSIILPLILTSAYVYTLYQAASLDEPIIDVIKLYAGLDDLYTAFSNESILLVFWLHFLAINLFLGSWISRDSVKYSIPRTLAFFPLILVYFTGPLGLVLYWMIRIFYAKKIGFHD